MLRRGIAVGVLGLMVLALFTTMSKISDLEDREQELMTEVDGLSGDVESLQAELDTTKEQRDILKAELDDLLTNQTEVFDTTQMEANNMVVRTFKLTGYAPFDNKSGMCHDGDPTRTASGSYPTRGRTIAVDPKVIPLGTPVWVQGHGWLVAEDTGGLIKGDKIDIMVDTYEETLDVTGEALVVYPRR